MPHPSHFNLYDVLANNAARAPEAPALIHGEDDGGKGTVGFATLLERADQLGSGLAREGLRRGDRFAVVAHNSVRFVEILFAAARQGLVAVPLNWRWQPEEMRQFLSRAGCKAAFYDAANEANTLEALGDGVEILIEIDSELEAVGAAKERGARGFAELRHRRLRPAPRFSAQEPFCIIATAAVDVIPRGAVLSHENLIVSATQEIASLGIGPGDGNVANLPLFHIAGLGHLVSFLQAGARNALQAKFDAAAAVQLIDEHQLTYFATFPPMLSAVLDAAETAGSSLPSLRWVSGLDAPDTVARLHEATEASFLSGFGQSETSGFVTLQNTRTGTFCAGRPVDTCRVQLMDDLGESVPTGEVGEIAVRGPLVFLGYDGQDDVNEYTFRHGWHHTGDLGRFDDEGRLHYVARKPEKELIKPGGENVYPAEVEAVLVQMDGVRRACVFGIPHERWGEGIAAVLEVDDGVEISLEETRAFVGERIAGFKRPHVIHCVSALPETADGEVDRSAVKAQHRA